MAPKRAQDSYLAISHLNQAVDMQGGVVQKIATAPFPFFHIAQEEAPINQWAVTGRI